MFTLRRATGGVTDAVVISNRVVSNTVQRSDWRTCRGPNARQVRPCCRATRWET